MNEITLSALRCVRNNVDDLAYVRKETPYVGGLAKTLGGSGDPLK